MFFHWHGGVTVARAARMLGGSQGWGPFRVANPFLASTPVAMLYSGRLGGAPFACVDEKCLCFAVEEIMEPRWMKKLKMKKGQSKSTVLKTWILNSH